MNHPTLYPDSRTRQNPRRVETDDGGKLACALAVNPTNTGNSSRHREQPGPGHWTKTRTTRGCFAIYT